MRQTLRFACLGGAGVLAIVAACSSAGTDDGGGDQPADAAPGGQPDAATVDAGTTPDAAVGDAATSDVVTDAEVDAGPKCKTASCALSLAAAPYSTCALLGDHTVKCWGENLYGQLGVGEIEGGAVNPPLSAAPLSIVGLTDAVAIAGGGQAGGSAFMCTIQIDGSVRCWGSNAQGQLGGASDAAVSVTGGTIQLDASAAQLDLGMRHGCVIDTAGSLRCWGDPAYGERGAVPFSAMPLPTDAGLSSLSLGFFASCVTTTRGEVICLGYNVNGQANPYTAAASVPATVVDAGAFATGVSQGQGFTCAMSDGGISCWGNNTGGQLGHAGATATNLPASPSFAAGLAPVQAVLGDAHGCAIMADRGVDCWGSNSKGQAGDFSGKTTVNPPGGVGGISNVVGLALGHEHSCSVNEDGDVYCWGSNTKGQLGPSASSDGGPDNSTHPDPVKIPL